MSVKSSFVIVYTAWEKLKKEIFNWNITNLRFTNKNLYPNAFSLDHCHVVTFILKGDYQESNKKNQKDTQQTANSAKL